MDLGIKGRVAIVTGGSRGIGKETSREFLEAGVKVMTCSRHGDELNETCKELAKTTGGEIHSMVADMTNPEDIKKLVNKTLETYGTVDILINNAGTMYSGRFAELTDEGLQTQLDTKLFGLCELSAPYLQSCGRKNGGALLVSLAAQAKNLIPICLDQV
jgi:3-oxoacyl-[acyl-carrier protein] reductase